MISIVPNCPGTSGTVPDFSLRPSPIPELYFAIVVLEEYLNYIQTVKMHVVNCEAGQEFMVLSKRLLTNLTTHQSEYFSDSQLKLILGCG